MNANEKPKLEKATFAGGCFWCMDLDIKRSGIKLIFQNNMAQNITTEELKKKIDDKESFYLIDTLMANSFEGRHIPTAKSVPYAPDFVEKFEKEIGVPKDVEIIVYCASSGCQLSVLAADTLEKAGYTNVKHFADGLAGWQDAGYQFESGK